MVLSLRLIDVENYMIVALDQASYGMKQQFCSWTHCIVKSQLAFVPDLFQKHRINTYLYSAESEDGKFASKGALHHESPEFMDLMHLRLSAILELLYSGLNVWFTGE